MRPPVDFSSFNYVPSLHWGAGASFVASVGILGVGVGAGIAYLWWLARSLRQTEIYERSLLETRRTMRLLPGRARVAHGRVEQDEGSATFSVEIVQRVKNCTSKNATWHDWHEVSRRVNPAPFYLVREDGETVYIEPSERVLFVDNLVTEYPTQMLEHRVQRAEARVGEELHVFGNLFEAPHPRARDRQRGDAYRGEAKGLVMRAPQGAQMLLASGVMNERYIQRIHFLRRSAKVLGAMWIAFHLGITVPFLITLFFGTSTMTNVVGTHTFVTRGKSRSTTHYVLETATADGLTLDAEEVNYEIYAAVKSEQHIDVFARAERPHSAPVSVPMLRVGTSSWFSTLGHEAHVSGLAFVFAIPAALLAFVIVYFNYLTKFAWYDRAKLNERGGDGHWTEWRDWNAPASEHASPSATGQS